MDATSAYDTWLSIAEQHAGEHDKAPVSRRRIPIELILVPIDFSPGAQRALRYAAAFATRVQAKLRLLHVLEPFTEPEPDGLSIAGRGQDAVALARGTLASLPLVEDLDPGLFHPPLVLSGIACYEIVRAAQSHEADLIILPSHSFAGLQHVWLGSTAERLAMQAPCPVLIVESGSLPAPVCGWPAGADTSCCLRRIAVLNEPPGGSPHALRYASGLAEQFGASLDLLHVIALPHRWAHLYPSPGAAQAEQQERTVWQRLMRTASASIHQGIPFCAEVKTGCLTETVTAFVREHQPDLLLLCATLHPRLRHKSWARLVERLIRHPSCPLLILPQTPTWTAETKPTTNLTGAT